MPSAQALSAANDQPPPWEGPLQILALDGGGLKGLFPAALLAQFEQDLETRICDHFDLIVGTSTGGLIALGIGAGVALPAIVDFYVRLGPTVFKTGPLPVLKRLVHAKHSARPLRRALDEVFGDRLLGESVKRLVIPSYSLDDDDVYLFKTPHHTRLKRDGQVPMVAVALATSAAPTYLPAARVGNQRLIDGGVWANNPTFVGVAEAVSMLGASLDQVRVLSLGTTDPVASRPGRLDHGGFLQWGRPATSLLLRAQALGTFHASEHLLGQVGRLTRIDPTVEHGLFDLDKLDPVRIRGLAETVSRKCSPLVEEFTKHRAAPYVPTGKVRSSRRP
jgi:predicted acylesterase/phospholipase RssA